ncbi:hypothetical protein JY651_41735 [Pyxidicoccus parkwayensis]|uniref:Bacterial surface antigen (D15) domain-containing protein n=1 Tax=Pyxidicoccus parkwayensis TaxID=2813578 RepID=A0ABX7NRV7_9BACT|nr:hypothetical protein [Pyxidicoccus parkwaysis]QSQ21626.1 hypothetical protein JY651_41735 [Pyxidicoccus parkwaysis]
MRLRRGWAAVWLWLLPGIAWTQDGDEPPRTPDLREAAAAETSNAGVSSAAEPETVEPAVRKWHYLTRLEATTWTLLPRTGVGVETGFVQIEPLVVIDGGPEFGINVGAPVRLRLWGGGEGAGLVRHEDWDTLSDWGQLFRGLKFGSDNAPLGVWFGALEDYSLLTGHLVRRYSNRTNPDYHPAGGFFTGTLGPLYTEAFASDVLGARLMGAELSLDVQHVLFGQPPEKGRYTLALSAVHDWGRAGGRAPSVTLAHLDATAIVVVRPGFEAHVVAGWGGRPGEGDAWGAVAGGGLDAVTPTLDLWLRLEVRHQHGGFRQGYFGPDYELARFRAAGPDGLPLAEARFPSGHSAYGELKVGWDAVSYGGLQRHLMLTLGVEAFTWGRFDVDGRVAVQLFQRNLELAVKGLGVGMGKPGARYLGAAEGRWRFLGGKLYAMGTGGTLLFPGVEGTLRPGAFASVGLGVDNAR